MTALPAQIDYVCANNRTLSVVRTPEQRLASVSVEGKQITLIRMPSAAQEKYGDNRYTLYLEGEVAMLEELGTVVYGPCASPVSLPTYYR